MVNNFVLIFFDEHITFDFNVIMQMLPTSIVNAVTPH